MDDSGTDETDLEARAAQFADRYRVIRPNYELLAEVARHILKETLADSGIRIHSIEARAKAVDSFQKKVAKPSESDPSVPKYRDPLHEITDLTGVRVITFLPRTVDEVCECVAQEFTVLERTDKSAELLDAGKLGYQSIHFLVQMHPDRVRLAEYRQHQGRTFEIQVRTLLQHAWAEMEHDIQYKSASVIPGAIRKKFIALAGMLEIADREFQSLQDEDEQLRKRARESVQTGNLSEVEITPDALRSYVDNKLGADGRMKPWSYEFTAKILRQLGFNTLAQLDDCISGYDDDIVSRTLWGSRQGQLSRLEDTVLAAMGEIYLERHPWATSYPDWLERSRDKLKRLSDAGIGTRSYRPA